MSHVPFKSATTTDRKCGVEAQHMYAMRCDEVYLVIVFFVEHAFAIQWLALANSTFAWNKTSHCIQAKKSYGLKGRQFKICQKHLDSMTLVVDAAQSAIHTCQSVFSDRRWNCSSIAWAPNFPPDLTTGTREQAFTYALTSASVAHSIARGCSDGSLLMCGCGRIPNEPPDADFKWGGCADNVRFGVKLARDFVDAPWNTKSLKKTPSSQVNRHNNKAGRRAVRDSLRHQCKCHGVSGSCNIKTCWRALPNLRHIAERLKRKYSIASEVIPSQIGTKWKLIPANSQLGMYRADDLIYLTKSPDYCLPDPRTGSFGTRGRWCNASSDGTDGCDSMCCGRGYLNYSVQRTELCFCKYYYCCYVKCQRCQWWQDVQTCV